MREGHGRSHVQINPPHTRILDQLPANRPLYHQELKLSVNLLITTEVADALSLFSTPRMARTLLSVTVLALLVAAAFAQVR